MAKGTGVYGAYKNTKPIKEDFGDILLEHEQIGFQKRAEQREIQKAKDEKSEKLTNRMVAAHQALSKIDHTGIKSEDEKRGKLALKAADMLNEVSKKLEKNPYDVEASLMLSNLEQFPERFAQMTTNYTTWMQDGIGGMKDKKYSTYLNKGNIDKVEKVIQGQVMYDIDAANGNIIGTYDKDGDGTPDFSWDGMATGVDLPEYKAMFDDKGFMSSVKSRYGYEHTKNPDGSYTDVEVKSLSEASRKSIKDEVNEAFGDFKNMTDNAKSYIGDILQKDPETLSKEDFETIKTNFYLQNLNQFDNKNFTTFDRVAKNRDAETWRKAQKDKEDAKKKTKEQEEADWLRTLVDGTISGDGASVGSWVGRTIGKDKDKQPITIDNAEWLKDELILTMSNGQVKVINTKDKDAVGKIMSMADPTKSQAELMKAYDKGETEREFEKVREKKFSRGKLVTELKAISKSSGNKVKEWLKEKGFNASNGGWFADNETIKIGKKSFDVATEKGRIKLLDFMMNEEAKANKDVSASDIDKLPDLPE